MGSMLLMIAVGGMFAYAVVDIFNSDPDSDFGAANSNDNSQGDLLNMDDLGGAAEGPDDGDEDAFESEAPDLSDAEDDDEAGNDDVVIDDGETTDDGPIDAAAGDTDTPEGDETPTDPSDILPEIPVVVSENDLGGRDVDVTLSEELAAQLVAANGQFGFPQDGSSLGWLMPDGDNFEGLFGVDDLTPNDRINLITPDDFAYDITAFYSSYTIDGPGFQGDRLLLSITPEGTYDADIPSTQPVIEGGPLFETTGVDFGPEFVGVSDQADIDALVQSVADDIDVPADQIAFGTYKVDIYDAEDTRLRRISTDDGLIPFFIGPNGGLVLQEDSEDPTVEVTELDPDNVEEVRVYLLQGIAEDDDRVAVVAVAELPSPRDFVQTVFRLNGGPLVDYNRLFYFA